MERMILRVNHFPISRRLDYGKIVSSWNRWLVILCHCAKDPHNGSQGYENLKFHSNYISFPDTQYATRNTQHAARAEFQLPIFDAPKSM
jgi:hypothetical protein